MYIKIDIKTAPTCFGAVTPSSGSALFELVNVMYIKRNVAECYVKLKCCDGRCVSVVRDTEKQNGMLNFCLTVHL